jgi:hypothetical protein
MTAISPKIPRNLCSQYFHPFSTQDPRKVTSWMTHMQENPNWVLSTDGVIILKVIIFEMHRGCQTQGCPCPSDPGLQLTCRWGVTEPAI